MTTEPESQGADHGRRRRLIAIGLVVAAIAVVAGLALAWFFFFGSEAPAAPSIDDAIKVLLPTASPGT